MLYISMAFCYVHIVVTARSFAVVAPSVCTAVSPANVSVANLPVSSCAFQMPKPTVPYVTCDLRVSAIETETQQSRGAVPVEHQVFSADKAWPGVQQSTAAARPLLTVNQRHPVQYLSKSTDRMTGASQQMHGQLVDAHGSNVQRSHSFNTTSQPTTHIGLTSSCIGVN